MASAFAGDPNSLTAMVQISDPEEPGASAPAAAGAPSSTPYDAGGSKSSASLPATPAAASSHRLHNWAARSSDDFACMDVLRATQEQWATNHPDPKLLLKREFPTSRRDALKVTERMMARSEKLMSPEYAAAIGRVLGSFPEQTRRTLNYVFLNYLSPYQKLVQQQGRHLFVIKCYKGREESHCWFIPLAEVETLHAAAAESLRQGISYNDLALTQTYSVPSVLAVHAECWEPRHGQSHNAYGECTWIGGMAFHYAMGEDVREASRNFAEVPTEAMPELAAKIAKNRDKKARQKANRRAKAAEEDERKKEEEALAEAEADATRRAGLVQVHASLAEGMKSLAKTLSASSAK